MVLPANETMERETVLHSLEDWLQGPMLALSFIWLLIVLAGLIWGEVGIIETFGTAIWVVFVLEFTLRLALAPNKLKFITRNWLTVIALILPAFRMLRIVRSLRVIRAMRGLRLVRVVGSLNRGMNATRMAMRRRGAGYVIALTLIIAFLGAGGMLSLEPAEEWPGGFTSYGDALWWTAMLLTTMGSGYWPQSAEGRLLCFLLSLYGLGVLGYITATLATVFLGSQISASSAE